jgi:hypothetical protein
MPTNFDSDAMLSFVSELTKRFADLKKEMANTAEQSGAGLHKTTDETERFGKTVEKHTKNIAGMRAETSSLVDLLRGPVGIASLFTGAALAVNKFVQGELQLRNFSTDVGLSAAAVAKLRTQLSAAGIDSKTADQQISALTSKLDSIKTLTTASPVYKDIAANDPILAKQLLDSEKVGNRLESIRLITEKLNRTGEPRSTQYTLEHLGLNASTGKALGKDTKDLVMPWIYSEAELEEYNKNWTNLTTTMTNVWGAAMMGMTATSNKLMEDANNNAKQIRETYQKLRDDFEGKGKSDSSIFGSKGFLPSKKEIESLFGGGEKPSTFSDRFGQWGDDEGEDGANLPKHAKPRSFSPDSVKDELELEKDQNKTLQDIRDALTDKMGGGAGAGASAPSSGSTASGNTPGTPNRVATGADGHVPETTSDPAYGGTPGAPTGLNRDKFRKELEAKPWLKEKILGIASGENKDPTANLAVIESMMNRAQDRGTSLEQAAKLVREGKGGYYAGYDPGGLRNAKTRAMIEANLEKALGGSNVSDYATDNASGGLAQRDKYKPEFQFTKEIAKESFFRGRNNTAAHRAWLASIEEEKKKQASEKNKENTAAIDKSLVASRDLGGAKIKVDFTGAVKDGKSSDANVLDEGPFKKLKIHRSPQAPAAGGGVADFNRFAFE